jgi:hypothetical protein
MLSGPRATSASGRRPNTRNGRLRQRRCQRMPSLKMRGPINGGRSPRCSSRRLYPFRPCSVYHSARVALQRGGARAMPPILSSPPAPVSPGKPIARDDDVRGGRAGEARPARRRPALCPLLRPGLPHLLPATRPSRGGGRGRAAAQEGRERWAPSALPPTASMTTSMPSWPATWHDPTTSTRHSLERSSASLRRMRRQGLLLVSLIISGRTSCTRKHARSSAHP